MKNTNTNHKAAKKTTSNTRSRAYKKVMKNRKKAMLQTAKRVVFTILLLSVLIGAYTIIETLYFSPAVVEAEDHLSEIKYKVIEIQYGDTLWSIAEDNITPGFRDVNEYIDEVIACNQLTSDRINEGCYLMVPYYEVLTGETTVACSN